MPISCGVQSRACPCLLFIIRSTVRACVFVRQVFKAPRNIGHQDGIPAGKPRRTMCETANVFVLGV